MADNTTTSTDNSAPPTPLTAADAFKPVLANIDAQELLANQRYAENAADIKNIFGNLTTIREADKAKIAQQFQTSIQNQQAALAGRTAEVRAANAAGAQGAAQAGTELGGGPATVGAANPLAAQAAEQGIGQSNALMTNWSGLMGATQEQTQQNLANAISGYGYQQVAAQQDLAKNLRDRLAQLGTERSGVQSQIAQSQLGAQATGLEMAQESALAQEKNKNALQVAQTAAQARLNASKNAANATITAAQIRAAAAAAKGSKAKTPKDTSISGWTSKMAAAGATQQNIDSIMNMVQKAYDKAGASASSSNSSGGATKNVAPTAGQVWNQWLKMYGSKNVGGKTVQNKFKVGVQDYITNYLPK